MTFEAQTPAGNGLGLEFLPAVSRDVWGPGPYSQAGSAKLGLRDRRPVSTEEREKCYLPRRSWEMLSLGSDPLAWTHDSTSPPGDSGQIFHLNLFPHL